MPFEISLTAWILVFALAYFLGRKFRVWLPLGKEFKIGSFNVVGLLIVPILPVCSNVWKKGDSYTWPCKCANGLSGIP